MSGTTELSCGTCGAALRAGARFCVACGNPAAAGSAEVGPRCGQCGAALGPGQPFCSGCGAATGAREAATDEVAGSVVRALEGVLAPYGSVVLVERPGQKRSRRCEVAANERGQLGAVELERIVPLLEETLVWDGFLFAEVRAERTPGVQCVWHVLNGDVFALDADHAVSLLVYLDVLRPLQWSERESDTVQRAPDLDFL